MSPYKVKECLVLIQKNCGSLQDDPLKNTHLLTFTLPPRTLPHLVGLTCITYTRDGMWLPVGVASGTTMASTSWITCSGRNQFPCCESWQPNVGAYVQETKASCQQSCEWVILEANLLVPVMLSIVQLQPISWLQDERPEPGTHTLTALDFLTNRNCEWKCLLF